MIVEGRVQGVGFRGHCQVCAMRTNVTGSVKNLSNGMVEIFAQGEEENIDKFMIAIKNGNQFIRVDNISMKEVALVEGEKRFGYGN